MIEITKEILERSLAKMEENSYHNLCLMEAAVTNPFATIYINDIDIEDSFNAAYNKNAKYIYFTRNEVHYLKFSLSINLNTKADDLDRKKKRFSSVKSQHDIKTNKFSNYLEFLTLTERGKMNRTSLEVYIAGYKIPDAECLITILSGSIDLYVPEKYFHKYLVTDMYLVINKYNEKYPYISNYVTRLNSKLVQLPYIKNEDDIRNLRIYVNGALKDKAVYDTTNNILDLTDILPKDENEEYTLEFYYRNYTQYSKTKKYQNILRFKKSILKDKPITADIFECYIDGRRVYSTHTKNITPRHIEINNGNYPINKETSTMTYYLVYDPTFPEEKNIYIDDVTQFFNYKHRDAVEILQGKYDGFLPEYIKNLKFPPKLIKVMNEDRTRTTNSMQDFLVTKTKEYIKENAETFKTLLRNLRTAKSDYNYTYEYTTTHRRLDTSLELGEIQYIKFSTEKVIFIVDKYEYANDNTNLIFIDGVKISSKHIIRLTYKDKVYLYIDKEIFKPTLKSIRIMHFPVYNKQYNFIKLISNEIIIKKSSKALGIIQDISDLFVMMKDGDGYKAIIDIARKETDKEYRITILDYDNTKEYILYNASISSRTKFTVTEDMIANPGKFFTFNYDLNLGDTYYPMSTLYDSVIMLNGRLLTKNVNYKLFNQFTNYNRNKAEILLAKKLKAGDVIEIYYLEATYETLGYVDYINSEYGLVYFDDLELPYDSGYIDLYVNGALVPSKDVETISTNMVKIYNVPYISYVSLRSKLQLPLYVLRQYIDTFIDNPSLWDEYIKQYWYNTGRIDEFYDELNPGPKDKIPYVPPEDGGNYDILADSIAKMLLSGLLPRLIDCNIYYDFSKNPYIREFLTDRKDYILIDCNKTNLSVDCNIDAEKTLKSFDEIVAHVDSVLEEHKLTAMDEIPDDSPLWNEIYYDELFQAEL